MRSTTTQPKRSTRMSFGAAFLVGALTLVGCGSEASETAAADGDSSLDQVDGDAADRLEEAQDQLEEMQDSGSLGTGSGLITIDGVDYSFDAKVCYSEDHGFEATGPGETADGIPYWASISTGIQTRDAMVDAGLPEANVDAFFGDKDSIESFGLEVEMGKEGTFTAGDDTMADYRIDALDITNATDLSYTIDGTSLEGTGTAFDNNGIVIEWGDTLPATFSASCN